MSAVRLAISVGCPCGIGPEVSVSAARAILAERDDLSLVLYGDASMAGLLDHPRALTVAVSDLSPDDRRPGSPTPASGAAQLAYVDAAVDAVLAGEADAIVTGPVSKSAITSAGRVFTGHTEHLAARVGVQRVVMMFAGPRLRASLVTTHVPIAKLPAAVDEAGVRFTVEATVDAMVRDFSVAAPRVAVTGLNPHAGEGGLLGHEDDAVIAPAVRAAQASRPAAAITGPIPAEAAFRLARDGRYDAVVAMYHDQATIASKLLDFGDAVNVTLGLPFVRTSVDHGTAYDIAGRGLADDAGMRAALALGASLAANRGR